MMNLNQPAETPGEAWARKGLYAAVLVATAYLTYYVLILGWTQSGEWLLPPHDILLPIALAVWGVFALFYFSGRLSR
jgi:hypothetical protein